MLTLSKKWLTISQITDKHLLENIQVFHCHEKLAIKRPNVILPRVGPKIDVSSYHQKFETQLNEGCLVTTNTFKKVYSSLTIMSFLRVGSLLLLPSTNWQSLAPVVSMKYFLLEGNQRPKSPKMCE